MAETAKTVTISIEEYEHIKAEKCEVESVGTVVIGGHQAEPKEAVWCVV